MTDGKIPREDLLAELQRLAEELGKTPTQADMTASGAYSVFVYHDRFGSWTDALEAAGLSVSSNAGRKIPREDLLEALKDFGRDRDRPPTVREMNEDGPYHSQTYRSRFGSWTAALEAAGYDLSTLTDRGIGPQPTKAATQSQDVERGVTVIVDRPTGREEEVLRPGEGVVVASDGPVAVEIEAFPDDADGEFGVCPHCEWQHSYEVLKPEDGEEMVFCPRTGVVG